MVVQPSSHGRGAVVVAWRVLLHFLPQRPDTPAEVVPHNHQPGASLVKAQLFAERVRLAFLPGVELPLSAKPALHETGVDRPGLLRLRKRLLRLLLASQ